MAVARLLYVRLHQSKGVGVYDYITRQVNNLGQADVLIITAKNRCLFMSFFFLYSVFHPTA